MTSLAEERAEQRRWRLRREFAGLDIFDQLVENEFAPAQEGEAWEASALREIVAFAAGAVPYYRDLFARLRLDPRAIRDRRDLALLPVLTRRDLAGQFEHLRPARLPDGEQIFGTSRSSGSTGHPTTVVCSVASNNMFSYLNQRQNRWFRRDPMRTSATIRLADNAPPAGPGRLLADGDTLRAPRWRYVGVFFETGPHVYFNITNPVEAQLAWLRRERPDYLLTRSHSLEHLAMAAGGERPCESLLALTAISEVLTPRARRRVEQVFGAPLHDGYGLNEIGLVAGRCEANRYHVHREHCIVEIVDEAGAPAAPGTAGRLLVSGLQNRAMPLLRYDTDDLVTALAGPCPCGRTLPSFGGILGRYSRLKALPPGTVERADALRSALHTMPVALARDLRRYQIHRLSDGSFELRVMAVTPVSRGFREHLERAWQAALGEGAPPLAVREVADIPNDTHGDKFDDFLFEEDSGLAA